MPSVVTTFSRPVAFGGVVAHPASSSIVAATVTAFLILIPQYKAAVYDVNDPGFPRIRHGAANAHEYA
jgi:hypothetical protein